MAIFHNGKQIQDLYHNGKKINTLYHNGKKIYQWYLPANTVLWSGNAAYTTYSGNSHGGGSLINTNNPIQLSESILNIKNGLIFNFGGGVYVDTSGMWSNQPDTTTRVSKNSLTNKVLVVKGLKLWQNDNVYAQLIDDTHISFTSSDGYNPGPMSTCIGWVNANNNGYTDGYYFSICKSIISY